MKNGVEILVHKIVILGYCGLHLFECNLLCIGIKDVYCLCSYLDLNHFLQAIP